MITELTPDTTSQELFDYITTFLLKQGKPSVSRKGACMYRGPVGTMCAVGCIIPDSLYLKEMEVGSITSLIYDTNHYAELTTNHKAFFRVLLNHEELLVELQTVHDSATGVHPKTKDNVRRYWDHEFTKIARKLSLKYTPLVFNQ